MTPSMYELRVYTLDSEASADAYEGVWRRHLTSLPLWKIHVYGMWRPIEKRNVVVVLTGLPSKEDADKVGRGGYMASEEFKSDFADFEGGFEAFRSKVISVEATRMSAIAGSPMR